MEPTAPDLLALSQSDRQFCQFAEQKHILQPKQLALALKIQKQQRGPLALILWQLGFVGLQHLAEFWERMPSGAELEALTAPRTPESVNESIPS
ncbi:DUF2949 domain-containing protein [Synechococcus sp. Nb3U1]|uniref:DUF2949 domain-containing protein n=1 Tax=Synechococcus sp. Nb3U1 TaxID=1914529 RepID=UPI001F1C08D8|nr:DUF2949 domain-containing protein [Synechococcus sp. Nb3U1]MCF2970804.1 DUF2949 domain-containing protein [Synechococcus sp. Nb3U1]